VTNPTGFFETEVVEIDIVRSKNVSVLVVTGQPEQVVDETAEAAPFRDGRGGRLQASWRSRDERWHVPTWPASW
jgi:hypothetical protein